MGDVEMGRMHQHDDAAAFGQLDGSVAENDQLGRGAAEGALASIRWGWKSWRAPRSLRAQVRWLLCDVRTYIRSYAYVGIRIYLYIYISVVSMFVQSHSLQARI